MKENQFMSILFWLYTQKKDNTGKAPIYCRITLDGNRTQFSTAKRVHPDHWISTANKVSNKCPDAIAINEDLETIKGDLRKVYNQLTAMHKHVTGEMVKRAYSGKDQERKTIMDLFRLNISLFKEKYKQRKAALKTVQRFNTVNIKLQSFLKKEYGLSDKPLCELNSAFGENFRHYLTVHESLTENTINKYLKITRQVFSFGVLKKWIDDNPMKHMKCPYRHPHREILNMAELQAVQDVELPSRRLNEVRDVYIFCCYTGYAYVEVSNLSPNNIVIGMDGNRWANVQRQKTGEPEMVPLLPPALQIIERYKDHPWCIANNKLLPVISNQKYNQYLKEVAQKAHVTKYLTTHTARHTFATTILLDNDVPLETASKLLGHSSIRSTQIYAKVSLKKLSNNMRELKTKLFPDLKAVKTGS